MTEPRRVHIGWDYAAHGIWWVLTSEEKQGLVPPGRRSGAPQPRPRERPRPWGDRLSGEQLDDLRVWNDAYAAANTAATAAADASMVTARQC